MHIANAAKATLETRRFDCRRLAGASSTATLILPQTLHRTKNLFLSSQVSARLLRSMLSFYLLGAIVSGSRPAQQSIAITDDLWQWFVNVSQSTMATTRTLTAPLCKTEVSDGTFRPNLEFHENLSSQVALVGYYL